MAKSLTQLKSQIEKLVKEAASIQEKIVARIKKEISAHGLTVDHLFGHGESSASEKTKTAKPKTSKTSRPPKFVDGAGNVWGGMGKRPEWIRAALAAGKSLDEFLVKKAKAAASAKKATPVEAAATKSPRKTASPAKKETVARPTSKAKAPAKKSAAAKKAAGEKAIPIAQKSGGKATKAAPSVARKAKAAPKNPKVSSPTAKADGSGIAQG